MKDLNGKKVTVVYKKSSYDLYKDSSDSLTREYAQGTAALRESHECNSNSLETVVDMLNETGAITTKLYRGDIKEQLEEMIASDLIVVVGGDGTVLDVSHYLLDSKVPILAVNSDPKRSVGFFSHSDAKGFRQTLHSLDDRSVVPENYLQRLEVRINGQKILEPVLNEVALVHQSPAALTRYSLQIAGKQIYDGNNSDSLRSAGIIISTPAGSTAWNYSLGGEVLSLDRKVMQIHERSLRGMEGKGVISKEAIILESKSREGVLYIDGEHCKYEVGLGDIVEIKLGEPLLVLGDIQHKQQEYARQKITRYQRSY
ncbi:hypothetical protein HOA92_03320 [archaeon]|jgi:NAD+ kinase|nr:hypothetical protein [archaeon]MBT6762044.1 hypothetical protein [archaeon]MBT7929331.1 hypothetical protein [Candidatus Peregrinibacteria bacterium]